MKAIALLVYFAVLLWSPCVTTGAYYYAAASAGGTPTGNSFTFVSSSFVAESSATINVPASAVGDLVVISSKWENTGTCTGFTADSGETVTSPATVDNAGSSGEPHVRMGWFIRATSGASGISRTGASGTLSFSSYSYMIFRAAGTISQDTEASGNATSGTAIATGTFTTGTVNGLTCACAGNYGGSPNTPKVNGTAATGSQAQDGSLAWYYLNTSQLIGATSSATQSNNRWTIKSISFKAL